jgi:hypothetical protein
MPRRQVGAATALSFAGGVTAEALEAAAAADGNTVRVVTTKDGPLVAGRGIYVATRESADAVATTAGGSTKYVANTPASLLKLMEMWWSRAVGTNLLRA